MAKIRHVAFMIKDTEKTKEWYEQAFGFEECYHSKSGAFMVMDGTFNIAILPILGTQSEVVGTHRADGGEADQRAGINHYGFVVDSVEEILERVGDDLKRGVNPQDGRPAEMRVYDPWGNAFDLSSRGFFGREEVKLPAVRQLVVQSDHPTEVAEFYEKNLELNEKGKGQDGSVYMSDGLIEMALVQEGLTPKTGVQYIGIQVDSWDATAERFKAMGQNFAPPKDPDGEVAVRDPEGNMLVLSQKGWAE
jgi:catechol 2,3-dioxygenase-like lactoylglutathione lyase family enzyme